jgi:hypothetical protein
MRLSREAKRISETPMYLAKFFHRPPGDDDRELLLMPGGDPVIAGIYMDESRQTQREDFLREEFSSMKAAAAAYRRHVAELVAAGYVETTHTKYTLRNLQPDPQPKPEWQKGLDDLMIAALSAPHKEQQKHLTALRLRTSRSISGSQHIVLTPPTRITQRPSGSPNRPATPSPPAEPASSLTMPGRSRSTTSKQGFLRC